jgi:MoaA/NifB/PqqE/SkfB family radical SAM enzyme
MHNLCLYPWYHLANTVDGRVKPCCIYEDTIKKSDGTDYYLQKDSIEDIYKSEYLINLRNEFLDGKKPSKCIRCWNDEEVGIQSKRQAYKYQLRGMGVDNVIPSLYNHPVDMQLILNNSCNLKCRICEPSLSSSWMSELKDYGESIDDLHVSVPKFPNGQTSNPTGVFIKNIDTWGPNIKNISCLGGEPFYSTAWRKMAETFITKNWSKNITLSIVTNATFYDKEYINYLLSNFKSLSIALSIDGMEEAFEYVRSNGLWSDVKENYISYTKHIGTSNFSLSVSQATSWLSLMQIPKFIEFLNKDLTDGLMGIWFSKVDNPYFFNPAFAPLEVREYAVDNIRNSPYYKSYKQQLDGLINYVLTFKISEDYKKYFKQHLLIDKQRGTNIWDVIKATDERMYDPIYKLYKISTRGKLI